MATNKPLYEEVAEKLIEALEKGTSPFQKPWDNDNRLFEFPYNPVTNKPYRGINAWWLMLQGHDDPRWLTFKQAQSMDWQVAKGAKAKTINYFSNTIDKIKLDSNKKPVLDENGNKVKIRVVLDTPIISTAKVFNAKDIIGIPPIELKEEHEWNANKEIDKIIKNTGVNLSHGGNSAFYNPIVDRIQMPKKQQFPTQQEYYSTLLHELGHWTGHKSRLDRPILNRFGTMDYAKEELRAEISSLMLESKFKLPHNFDNHAAYIKSWVSILKDEPIEIMKASADAQKIMDYVLEFEHKKAQVIEVNSNEQSIEQKDNSPKIESEINNKPANVQESNIEPSYNYTR